MQTILQLSDFHIKETMPLPENNAVYKDMIAALKRLNLENIILIYNGDLIDTNEISNKIDQSLPCYIKAQLWDEIAKKTFQLAKKYFEYLTSALSISNDRIIICCGNHDINPYCEETDPIDCPDMSKKMLYNANRFSLYADLCDQIQLRKNTWGTYLREIDNLNILVANTNWINKWKSSSQQPLCIACKQIEELINDKKELLLRTKNDKNKLYNIFVAHAPRTDYCEESRFRYEENGQSAAMELVDRFFGLKLFGDKHTDNVHNFDYIVGAPLDDNIITCGIHQFDNEYHHHHATLLFENKLWKLIGSEGDIEEILAISVNSLKSQALEYLFGSREVLDLATKIKNFEEVRSGEKWAELDRLIRSYADIQKPQSKGAGMPIDASDGFINTLTRLISDSTSRVSLTLRGEERLGKSVCMSLLYLNLLHRYVCGTFEYLPVYVNVEQIMNYVEGENRDTATYTKKLKTILVNSLSKGIELATRLHTPACCIIDGINKFYIYKNAKIEDMIANEIESKSGKEYSHVIYCIDTGNNTGLGLTPQHTKKDAEYVVYFNRILTKKVNSKKKYRAFVKAYCELKGISSADRTSKIVLDNIERMQILEVDTSLLINFWEYLSTENEISFFEVIDTFVNHHIEISEIVNAANACFMFYQRGKSYTDIRKECKISNSVFELIRTQKMVAKYLLAANYVFTIQTPGKKVTAESCLNVLYNHEICAFIRQYICKYKVQSQIMKFARYRFSELSFEGKATISYLLGRIECNITDIAEILDAHEKHLSAVEAYGLDEDEFYRSVAQRSVRLSKMFTEKDTCMYIRNYIRLLIEDSYERKINRVFYLQFYGDRNLGFNDLIFEGFDIYNTYHILASRLEAWKSQGKRYTLLDLELFTLCDLLQIRLDIPYAKSSNGQDKIGSFFYHSKFSQPNDNMAINVLGFITDIISRYLDQYGNTADNLIFIKYLSMQLKLFQNAIKKLEEGPLVEERDAFAPRQLFSGLCKLETEKRIGWEISDVLSEKISHEKFQQLREARPGHETILQHTFEAYLMGLLYLPARSKTNVSYDKQTILNMLLIHDLGETEVGDIVPAYEYYDKSREREQEFCEKLYLQGTRSNMADLSEYFFLWEAWCDSGCDDYNILVAKEIDKIQMLYKMLVLLNVNEIDLTIERVKEFWKSKNIIKTVEGKEIYNILIARETKFKTIAERYGLSISELK